MNDGSGCDSGGEARPGLIVLHFNGSGGGLVELFLGFLYGEKTSNGTMTLLPLPLYAIGLK